MDYGLRVYNDDLKLQIDSLYQNYALWGHGESVSTSNQGSYYAATVSFASASALPPLIAIKPSASIYCGLSNYTRSGSDYTGFVVYSQMGNAATFDWMAFVPRKDKSSETYGLRVYNDIPELVFDSGHRQMIIKDIDSASPAYNSVSGVTHPSDANAYFIMSPHGFWETVTNTYPPTSTLRGYLPMFLYSNDTVVNFGGVQAFQGSIPAPITFSGGYWPSSWTILTVKKAF